MGHASDGVDHGRCGGLLVVALMTSLWSSDSRAGSSAFNGPVIYLGVIMESSTCLLGPSSDSVNYDSLIIILSCLTWLE